MDPIIIDLWGEGVLQSMRKLYTKWVSQQVEIMWRNFFSDLSSVNPHIENES
ncbi:MAG: hypothetical protein HQL55_07030 [Magnetococcales bacterium]|nr:hypothetical protein [Magnetococcales bacterium]